MRKPNYTCGLTQYKRRHMHATHTHTQRTRTCAQKRQFVTACAYRRTHPETTWIRGEITNSMCLRHVLLKNYFRLLPYIVRIDNKCPPSVGARRCARPLCGEINKSLTGNCQPGGTIERVMAGASGSSPATVDDRIRFGGTAPHTWQPTHVATDNGRFHARSE